MERRARRARRARRTRRALDFSAGSAGSAFIVGLAVVFLALHLPYLPKSLEDLDSINFALGVRHFDVAHHQPHPPGYPVYIAIGKAANAVIPDQARALGVVSVVAGALGVLAIGALCRRLDDRWSVAATAVAMTSPLYYFTAARPLSDATGLAAAIAIQAFTLSAASTRALAAAAFLAGLATGIRSQVAWLTVPLIAWQIALHHRGRGGHGGKAIVASFAAGALVWLIPLVALTGGVGAYWRALVGQGAEDLGNIQMLWSRHGVRDVADGLYYAFVAPWASSWVAAFVLISAAVGLAHLWRRQPRTVVWLAVAFVPYLVLDLLFQETFTSRYALPLVVPIAVLAVAGLRQFPREAAIVLTIVLAMYDAHTGGTSTAAYASQKAPAFRLLDDMRNAAAGESVPPVLAPDRRESLDLRRPIVWAGDAMRSIDRQLPAPPQHEWLEPVKYWNSGGRAPVWFVVDPMRASIDLVQHDSPTTYRWSLPYPALVSGVRPNEMDWYRVDRPEWYVGEGWALTPEAAGVAQADRRGLAYGPIDGRIGSDVRALIIGGRNFASAPARLTIQVEDEDPIDRVAVSGWFLFTDLPVARTSAPRTVTIRTAPLQNVAIEQFDASATRRLMGFGPGWHEQEFNPRTGERWRWLSERGELRITRNPRSDAKTVLHLAGESPRKYFSRDSHLVVRVGSDIRATRTLSSDFSIDVPVGADDQVVVLETDQTYAPGDSRWRRSADRRHLGLRIFTCELR